MCLNWDTAVDVFIRFAYDNWLIVVLQLRCLCTLCEASPWAVPRLALGD